MEDSSSNLSPEEYCAILSASDWYITLEPLLRELYWGDSKNLTKTQREKRHHFTELVAEALKQGTVALAHQGPAEDIDRQGIDTIVIHHTHGDPEASLEYLDALGLLRLYVPVYLTGQRRGGALWSGHFYEGRQTFIGYHYLIRQDGTVHHILSDEAVGWQAGNWEVNCRSIAVCFMDTLDEKRPTEAALAAAQEIIRQYPDTQIVGHREVNPNTTCPGPLFLGEDGWKKDLGLISK